MAYACIDGNAASAFLVRHAHRWDPRARGAPTPGGIEVPPWGLGSACARRTLRLTGGQTARIDDLLLADGVGEVLDADHRALLARVFLPPLAHLGLDLGLVGLVGAQAHGVALRLMAERTAREGCGGATGPVFGALGSGALLLLELALALDEVATGLAALGGPGDHGQLLGHVEGEPVFRVRAAPSGNLSRCGKIRMRS
jgi:hypothetical protein